VLTEEHGERPWRRHDGAAMAVAARPPSRGCTGEGAASCSRPSGRAQRGGDVRVAAAVQPMRRPGEHRRARAGAPASAWARSTGAGLDGDGGDWRRGLTKPHGQEDERDEAEQVRQRGAANLAGARRSQARSTSATWIARKGLGLGFDQEGRE
jgi:hypothetical protein